MSETLDIDGKPIDCGDAVEIPEIKETWLVAFAEDGRVCCCGWPCSMIEASRCRIKRKATAEEREELIQQMANMRGDEDSGGYDPRKSWARRQLDARKP